MASGIDEVVSYVHEPAVVEISGGLVRFKYRSGNTPIEQCTSIRTATKLSDRIQRALRRHAAGEETIIVDD